MQGKGNKPNREKIIDAFFTQRLAAPHTAPLYHYDVLFSAGLIDLPYPIEELETMACDSIMRLLTIDIDNYTALIRPLVEKATLSKFEQLRYDRLMRDKERAMATRNEIALIAVGRVDVSTQALLIVQDMTKRHAIYWSKPIALISNLCDE